MPQHFPGTMFVAFGTHGTDIMTNRKNIESWVVASVFHNCIPVSLCVLGVFVRGLLMKYSTAESCQPISIEVQKRIHPSPMLIAL